MFVRAAVVTQRSDSPTELYRRRTSAARTLCRPKLLPQQLSVTQTQRSCRLTRTELILHADVLLADQTSGEVA